jgi:DNA polymerase-3 subunit alpha (Gram-positive type)
MQSVNILFEAAGIKIDNSQILYFKQIDVDVVNSRWNIVMYAKNLITADYYQEIKQKLHNHFKDKVKTIDITFVLEQSMLRSQDHARVIAHYHLIINSDIELKRVFEITNFGVLNNKLIFDIHTSYDQNLIQRNINKLSNKFDQLGLTEYSYDFKLLQDKNNEIIEKRIKEQEEKIAVLTNTGSQSETQLFGDDIRKKKTQSIAQVLDPNSMLINCTIEGEIFELELRQIKTTFLLTMMISDDTGTISVKTFPGFNNQPPTVKHLETLKKGMRVKIGGRKEFDRYANDEVIMMNSVVILEQSIEITDRVDTCEQKRVELHTHTKMSKNNGINTLEDYAKMAKHFGQKAVAITDHDVVQGYVDAESISKKYGIKIIYGVEAVVARDTEIVFMTKPNIIEDTTFVVFDVETTGLSANFNDLIEIGGVKVKNGLIIDRFQSFIKIDEPLSDFTKSLTGITDDDLIHAPTLKAVLQDFRTWSKDTVLVAHNAVFDMQFLARNYERVLNVELNQPVLDTLELSRFLNPESTYHSLKILAKKYGVALDSKSHHRADYDAEKTTEIFVKMIQQLVELEVFNLEDINAANNINKTRGNHNLIYVANQSGLQNLYKLVSDANTDDYQMEPRIIKSKLHELRNNLIYVGAGCSKSEIVDSYLNHSEEQFQNTIAQFDYVELLPVSQLYELINNGTFYGVEDIKTMHKKIYQTCQMLKIDVVANGNVHYIEPHLSIIKEVLVGKDYKPSKVKKDQDGIEQPIDKIKFKKWMEENKTKNSDQYFKSTNEMLEHFSYMGDDIAFEIVVTNTNKIADSVDVLKIIPDDLYTPDVPGVDEKLVEMVYEKAYSIYGPTLPEIVEKRIEKEVNSITKYGFSIIYYISHKLVKYSLDNGYLVGSRGSVGSSLVATFMDITEINPLAPHYVCPTCLTSEFILDGSFGSGFDLPIKNCENCNVQMKRDGQDIPFETFLGFEGDKVPDIDLNFSGDFQAKAHDFVRAKDVMGDDELFDFDHAFRAGTIGTIAQKTAFAYIKNYFDLLDKEARKTDISYYIRYCEGIKRTTGQHPGGIIVVPQHRDIYEFTPIQYPADDKKSPWRTTHFDFHSIHDNLLKLDILGHDDPTMLKKLKDMTGIDPVNVDITDPKVMELFSSTNSLGVEPSQIMTDLGTMGVPEFGTGFVMEMLRDTKPSTFAELVQISGLSHGTDVWLGNAKNLIDNGTCELKEVIGCRDDIMVYLMYQNLDPLVAFNIMENVRKGRGLTPDEINIMKQNKVPEWYIESCQKIKYMFPKAHAAAYVLMALRIAYFKVYYPLHYYSAYFGSRVSDFDAISMIQGSDALRRKIELISELGDEMSEVKQKSMLNSLKMSLEMVERGFEFLPFDLAKSQSYAFVINEDNTGLYMPFITIDGLGEKEAEKIVEEREIKDFVTKEEFKKRTRVKTKSFEQLEYFDVFEGLHDDNQITLF